MKRSLFLLIGFLYCNLTWQTIVWGNDFVHPIIAVFLVIAFPIFAGVAVYLIFYNKIDENWSVVFLASGILFPVFYMVSYATRAPEYVRFVHSGYQRFDGDLSAIASGGALFYTLNNFTIKDVKSGEFGVSYSSSTTKNSTSHAKHFVVPVFDKFAPEEGAPRVWLFASYRSGSSKADNGDHNLFGFDRTGLSKRIRASTVHGKRVVNDESRRAVAQYLKKKNLPEIEDPLVLELVDEPAEIYYRKAKIHFWVLTILLNIFFLGFSLYVSGKPEVSDKI